MVLGRMDFKGGAAKCTLSANIASGDLELTLVGDVSGWPTGASSRKFIVIIDRGKSNMEKIRVTSRSGSVLTISDRAYDGTAAAAHTAACDVEVGLGATVLDDLSAHVYDTTRDDHTQLLLVDGTRAFSALTAIAGAPVSVGTANAAGTALTLARSDHVHDISNGAIDAAALLASGIITLPKFGTGLRPVFVVANAAALAALTPTAGDLAFQTDTAALKQYQSVTTGWTAPWNLPWGRIIRTASTADQTFANSSENTLTNMNTSFTVVANRLYRVNAQGLLKNLAASVQNITVKLKLDGTLVEEAILLDFGASFNVGYNIDWELSPTSGSHALTLTAQSSSASGLTHRGTLGTCKLTVYDAGSSAAPA